MQEMFQISNYVQTKNLRVSSSGQIFLSVLLARSLTLKSKKQKPCQSYLIPTHCVESLGDHENVVDADSEKKKRDHCKGNSLQISPLSWCLSPSSCVFCLLSLFSNNFQVSSLFFLPVLLTYLYAQLNRKVRTLNRDHNPESFPWPHCKWKMQPFAMKNVFANILLHLRKVSFLLF